MMNMKINILQYFSAFLYFKEHLLIVNKQGSAIVTKYMWYNFMLYNFTAMHYK